MRLVATNTDTTPATDRWVRSFSVAWAANVDTASLNSSNVSTGRPNEREYMMLF